MTTPSPQHSEPIDTPEPLTPKEIVRGLFVAGITAQVAQDYTNQKWEEKYAIEQFESYYQSQMEEREAEIRLDERKQVYYVAHDIMADKKIPRYEVINYFDNQIHELEAIKRKRGE